MMKFKVDIPNAAPLVYELMICFKLLNTFIQRMKMLFKKKFRKLKNGKYSSLLRN